MADEEEIIFTERMKAGELYLASINETCVTSMRRDKVLKHWLVMRRRFIASRLGVSTDAQSKISSYVRWVRSDPVDR